jgi:putative ABC transport system permease protein
MINLITEFISGIAAISLLVGGIGIMDIMLVSVSERTREIGIRKAVGATNRQIRGQFLTEGLALSIAGGLIGVVVALAINIGLRIYTNLQPVVSVPVVLLAAGVSLIIGVVFSVVPAVKAARKNPIDALRNE